MFRTEGLSLTGVRRSGTKHIYRVCRVNLCLGRLYCDNGMSVTPQKILRTPNAAIQSVGISS